MVDQLHLPVINTSRLVLEPLSKVHSQGMFDLWSDPAVCEYAGIVRDCDQKVISTPTKTRSDSDRIIDFWQQAAFDGWGFRWALVLSEPQGAFVGTLGFNALTECAEIAFHLLPAYWGRGFMAEAARAAIAWLNMRGATHLEAFIDPENTASIMLARQLGMDASCTFSEGAQRYLMPL